MEGTRFENNISCAVIPGDGDDLTIAFSGDSKTLVWAAIYSMQFQDSHYDAGGHVSAASSLDELALEWLAKSDTAAEIFALRYWDEFQQGFRSFRDHARGAEICRLIRDRHARGSEVTQEYGYVSDGLWTLSLNIRL